MQALNMIRLPDTLKKRRDFLFVAQGDRASGRLLSLQERKISQDDNKNVGKIYFGITASKKVGNAVKRNRAKRRLRVAMKNVLSQYGNENHAYVAIARPQTIEADWPSLLDEVKYLVKRLSLKSKTKTKPE